MKKIYLLLLAIFCSIGMSWGDTRDFTGVYITFSGTQNGNNWNYYPSDNNSNQTFDLGNITSTFEISTAYLKYTTDWGDRSSFGGQLCYKINNGSVNYLGNGYWNEESKGYNKYEKTNTNCLWKIARTTDPSGKYTFEHWWQMWMGGTDKYINNSGSNYKFTYTILPPAVENLSISGAIAGSGTEEEPYIFVSGTNMTISAEQAHTDANSVLNQTSKTISENGSVAICYHNSTDDLNGPSTTIYYAVVSNPVITISNVGYTTYYNSKYAYTIPTDVKGYIFNASTRKIEKAYAEGAIVPAGEALVLKGTTGEKTLVLTTTANAKNANNALLGTDDQTDLTADDNSYFYGLSLNEAREIGSVGFYWMNETGAAFTNGAHKAYLKLAKSLFSNQAPAHFFFEDEEQTATGIEAIETVEQAIKFVENGKVYIRRAGVVYDILGNEVR